VLFGRERHLAEWDERRINRRRAVVDAVAGVERQVSASAESRARSPT